MPYRLLKMKSPLVIESISSSPNIVKDLAKDDALLKILVVEDNDIAARSVMSLINRLYGNSACDRAVEGRQAIEKVKENRYDLIFMDIGLGVGDNGIEVTKKIRVLSHLTAKQVPIVALTGHANTPEMKEEIIAAGMQEIVTKPLSIAQLESLMQQYIFKQDISLNAKPVISNILETVQVIDWAKSLEQCNGDEESLRELLSMLKLDIKISQEKIAAAYTSNDIKALREELHRVRGGIAYLTVPALDNAFAKFHEVVKTMPQNSRQLQQLYPQLQQAIDAFCEYVEKIGL
jgi:two-component system aerobic respiration control sensor histidine kinase ArcB